MLDQKDEKLLLTEESQTEQTSQENVTTQSKSEVEQEQLGDLNLDENQKVIDHIDNSNAEESEDEIISERKDIPMLDYENMSMEKLTKELEKLVATEKISAIKQHIDEIRKEFNSKYHDLIEEKKELYASQNEGSTLGFDYHFPLKNRFDSALNQYKERRDEHYKQIEINLKNNLKKRLEIIQELKNLLNTEAETKITDLFKHFNEIRERWRTAGPIPRDNYNHVWNTYHFHVENFYDFIHLDREARDMDFKHNLEQKQRIIERAKELLSEPSMNKAVRELHLLHRVWKEEIGPVDRKFREQIWNEFKEISKQIHDKRDAYFKQLHAKEEENLAKKEKIIAQIKELHSQNPNSPSQWVEQTKKIEELRKEFLEIGRVPAEKRTKNWDVFRSAIREFNVKRNAFYKNTRTEFQDVLVKKKELLKRVNQLKDSDDFESVTPIMKQIQEEWKNVGRLPKKISDQVWFPFQKACNHYFERLHASHQQERQIDPLAYDRKVEYLKFLENIEFSGNYKQDLELLRSHIQNWKKIGRVPQDKQDIESKYNQILDVLFDKISASKQESNRMKYKLHLESMIEANNMKKLYAERNFLNNKIEKIQGEILQLENNIMFVTGAKNKNPLFAEVEKNIEKSKQELQRFKDELKQLNSVLKNSNIQQES